ncbi:MAG: hypothetical protein HYZ57_11415 [Acidobacteria bacterium]|nr:hypothetical protein [Acidobacteriota bacterium]MBI3280438.1 hypothetical protein [Acidobacteriota bacterium]
MAALFCLAGGLSAARLPDKYFELVGAGLTQVQARLAAEPASGLEKLETYSGFRHFPSAILMAAVLYSKSHPANRHYQDSKTLETALAIGDLLAAEQEQGRFAAALDRHRDSYMWLDAFRVLEPKLDRQRRDRWRRALLDYLTPLAGEVAKRRDYPWYAGPYLGTSPNHYSLWSSTVYLAGRVLEKKAWESTGAQVMHRFAAEEQSPDGFWGEQNLSYPTTGYDYLTVTGVALYWEHSRDQAALEALRRNTDFHKYYTYPDGVPVETHNDRNRYWSETTWGQFGFSNFAGGRRYSEFLMDSYPAGRLSLEALGRMAQNALYYREGATEPIPQDREDYMHRMTVPAGIRKTGPWVVALSGIIDASSASRFRLDRQGHLSVFHRQPGLIITGANSKRQPELATFWEKVGDQLFHMPLNTRLRMDGEEDRLALAYNSFFSVLEMPRPSAREAQFRFVIHPKGGGAESSLNLQLCLKAGQPLETGAGTRIVLGEGGVELGPEKIGGWIRHRGWTLRTDAGARLVWPVRPYNPYSNAPETGLQNAVGALSVPLKKVDETILVRIEVE